MSEPVAVAPLAGVRVLDIATFVAAPYCAPILSEFGAEAIKVEEPRGGDPFRRFGTPTERADSPWPGSRRRATRPRSPSICARPRGRRCSSGWCGHRLRELPAGDAGEVGAGVEGTLRGQPEADPAARHRLRADRAVQGPSGLRADRACRLRAFRPRRHAGRAAGDARRDNRRARSSRASESGRAGKRCGCRSPRARVRRRCARRVAPARAALGTPPRTGRCRLPAPARRLERQ